MFSRRGFIKRAVLAGVLLASGSDASAGMPVRKGTRTTLCTLYRAVNGRPDENLAKVIEMMGGVETLIGSDDVVIIKPNAQWWNQGAPNLLALKTFIDAIMSRPGGFFGEVVIAENCHRGATPWKSLNSGWAHSFQWNSDIPRVENLNDFSNHLKKKYGARFSTVHWIDVAHGGRRVFGPADGSGYVYCDGTGGVPLITCENGSKGEKFRSTIMTYPVFSTDKGTIIDFKNGIWKKGAYTGQPLRLINFAAMNHHSTYCGATSAVKNYLGVVDLSGGPDPHIKGLLTGGYYNFHSFPFDKWAPGPERGMLGKEVGTFMKTIRRADLNITTAEWVGLSSRTDPPVARTRAVLACTDSVALDYHAAKYILYPNSRIPVHNPDNKSGPLHHYLLKCAEAGGFVYDEENVGIKSFNFRTGSFQKDDELIVLGDKRWGNNIKPLLKYFILKYFIG
ncbi:MAG TPA: DUF362 domain-containing protein [Desulfobulbaceae bacterium]|nr:DUF362 domain-containing protein [Desulfobulbaceae bacterium]